MPALETLLEKERKKVEILEKMFEDHSRKLYLAEEAKHQSQIQLFNASKMASLGEMAGGIAHEINNPVAIIMLRAQQIKVMLEKMSGNSQMNDKFYDKCLEFAQNISNTAERITRIVNGLRIFARSGETDPFEDTVLAKVIAGTLSLCSEQIKNNGITLIQEIDESVVISCRPVQISQVLINIIGNAIYELANTNSKIKTITLRCYQEHQHAVLSITDTGRGIPKAVMTKVMEPFFTTKPVGEGTGLGLSISNSIVQAHHGHIKIDSKLGHTCFKISLPLITEKSKLELVT